MAGDRMPSVDPTKSQTPVVKAWRDFVRTPVGNWIAKNVAAKVDPVLLKASGGRVKVGVAFPTVNLTTTGRRSGAPRTSTVLYFTRGDEVILIASNFGSTGHPAWYLNLKAHPHAELVTRGRCGRYLLQQEATGAERDELYELAERLYGGYRSYKTKAGAREIPVLVLTHI